MTDGAHTAKITLVGDYKTSTFTASSDGNGGVSIVDPTPPQAQALVEAMAGLTGRPAAATASLSPISTPGLTPLLARPA